MDFGITPSRNHYELGQDPVSAHPTEESMLMMSRITNDLSASRPKVIEQDQSAAKKNLNAEFARILPLYGAHKHTESYTAVKTPYGTDFTKSVTDEPILIDEGDNRQFMHIKELDSNSNH